jgi:predicted HTH domain antitoxin
MFNGEIMKVVIDLPQNIKLLLNEVEKRVKIELALSLYKKGILSFEQARKLAELSKWEFIELLEKEGIKIVYDEEEFENDLKVIKEEFGIG